MAGFDIIDAARNGVVHGWKERKNYARKILIPIMGLGLGLSVVTQSVRFSPEALDSLQNPKPSASVVSDSADQSSTSPADSPVDTSVDVAAERGADMLNPITAPIEVDWSVMTFIGMGLCLAAFLYLAYVCVYQARFILLGAAKADYASKQKNTAIHKAYMWGIGIMIAYSLFSVLVKDPVTQFLMTTFAGSLLAQFAVFVVAVLFSVWVIRFGCAHIPAAIDYPIRDFLKAVRGFRFSVCLILMIALITLPFMTVVILLVSVFSFVLVLLPGPLAAVLVALLGAATLVLWLFIYNAASVYAVDEIMKDYAKK